MNVNGRCPQCHYHQPERIMAVVVRTSCPNCHYIEQGRRSPVFADLTELITWLAAQSGVPLSSTEFPEVPSITEEVPHADQICNLQSAICNPHPRGLPRPERLVHGMGRR